MVESVGTVSDCHKIGDRIDCDGHPGTVCYIGPVVDTNDAIRQRYGLVDDELAGVDRDKLSSLKREIHAPFLEMVGFSKVNKKQSAFDQLKVVWLRAQLVSSAGVPGELLELCPSVRELDISKNLINSWRIVADICLQLKRLERLDVSENLLPTKINGNLNAFDNVNQLVMTRMNYDWSDIEWCSSLFPTLRVLYVPFNNARVLRKPLENSSLSQLWRSISELEKLNNLEDLKLRDNPVFDNEKLSTTRDLIIARISKLKLLNGEEIIREERNGAEYVYLKTFDEEWKKIADNDECRKKEFIENHPRYLSLIKKCGITEFPSSIKFSTEMKSDVITVEFVSSNVESKVQNVKRKIMKDMNVQKVMGLVQRIFKISGKIPTLSLIPSNRPNDEIPLDKFLQELSYYSIQDGDKIIVHW
ncbi:hypothetical protein G9C98_000085 [Cotesia typhae]|uniref:Tubulin-specific chaperone E n=1 Tax=Cotesia typhae TaxID=2053667 RepID=A0A8J5VDJ1_9HYME|nr:hypothetical protein G9C98_000085 [Cotesia typhae]